MASWRSAMFTSLQFKLTALEAAPRHSRGAPGAGRVGGRGVSGQSPPRVSAARRLGLHGRYLELRADGSLSLHAVHWRQPARAGVVGSAVDAFRRGAFRGPSRFDTDAFGR